MTKTKLPPAEIVIRRYSEIAPSPALEAGLDAVFFEASNVKSFSDVAARRTFRERWLGRYLVHDPDLAFVAVSQSGSVLGYVVGSLKDPAFEPRFSDIPYFKVFNILTRQFPAHLHVNLAPDARNSGLGSDLVRRFISEAEKAAAPGVHVVTSRGARNVAFYNRNGFHEAGSFAEGGREIVFLARACAP